MSGNDTSQTWFGDSEGTNERAEIYYRTGNALLAEIDARLSAGTPIQELQAEVKQALFLACAYAGELLLGQPKRELH